MPSLRKEDKYGSQYTRVEMSLWETDPPKRRHLQIHSGILDLGSDHMAMRPTSFNHILSFQPALMALSANMSGQPKKRHILERC